MCASVIVVQGTGHEEDLPGLGPLDEGGGAVVYLL